MFSVSIQLREQFEDIFWKEERVGGEGKREVRKLNNDSLDSVALLSIAVTRKSKLVITIWQSYPQNNIHIWSTVGQEFRCFLFMLVTVR